MKKILILGQSLFEVIMALGLITLIIVAVVAMAEISIKNSSYSKNKTLATRQGEAAMEWLRDLRDKSWDDFYTDAQSIKWCLTNLSEDDFKVGPCGDSDVIFSTTLKREVVFRTINTSNIEATVNIYWSDIGGYHESVTSTIFTDWRSE